jgi:phosphohistidine phosphatase
MPRYLYLLRHAQSADKQIGQTDKERALTPTGLKEAKAVGFFFKEKSLIPELIITSSALRAKSTTQILTEMLMDNSDKIVIDDELYEATLSTYLQLITKVGNHVSGVLIVGHNPVITLFADFMTNQQNNFRPAEVLVLKSEAQSWSTIRKGNTEVAARFHPTV